MLLALVLVHTAVWAGDHPEAPTDPAKQQLQELMKQQRELRKGLVGVQERLGLGKDQEIRQLHEAYRVAKKALDDGIAEKTKLDPEGARLYEQIDALNQQIVELRKGARPERQPREKRRNNAGEGQ